MSTEKKIQDHLQRLGLTDKRDWYLTASLDMYVGFRLVDFPTCDYLNTRTRECGEDAQGREGGQHKKASEPTFWHDKNL